MANNTLRKKYFPIYRETQDDAGRVVKDPIGTFSCRMSTARFLDLDDLNFNFEVATTRKGGQRSKTLADGTTLGGTDTTVADSTVILSVSSRGSKTVVIKTGKKIADTKRTKNKDGAYHTISFRFPAWATVSVIADALGEIIPANKIKASPTATDIEPYFRIVGGRTYTINQKAAAEAKTDAQVPSNDSELQQLAQKSGKRVVKAAGE